MTAKIRKAKVQFDTKRYAQLLSKSVPMVIKTDKENERALALIDSLMKRGKDRLPEENALLDLLVTLVEKFEDEHYPIPRAAPHEVLTVLLEERDIKPADLVEICGSRGYVSDILNGKREISKKIAKKLAMFFDVPVDLFIL